MEAGDSGAVGAAQLGCPVLVCVSHLCPSHFTCAGIEGEQLAGRRAQQQQVWVDGVEGTAAERARQVVHAAHQPPAACLPQAGGAVLAARQQRGTVGRPSQVRHLASVPLQHLCAWGREAR